VCDRDEVRLLLTEVLPPLSTTELNREVEETMAYFSDKLVEEPLFIEAIMKNSYWKEAGPLVVKELIYLDCLNSYYYQKLKILDDDDYNDLKDQLTWEGSAAVSVSAAEARFIFAVSSFRQFYSTMS